MQHRKRTALCKAVLPALLLVALLAGCAGRNAQPGETKELALLILHTNDTHSYLAGLDARGNACFAEDGCRGGMGRIAAAIRTAKAKSDNVLALDAGDQFQGTLFYSVNKWPMLSAIDAHMPYDAMTLGNHEFDEGCGELARFLDKASFPVLAANLAPEAGCPLHNSTVAPYLIRTLRGTRVGIVGLANGEARELSAACPDTHFTGAAETLSRAVRELEAQGVRHIIAVTHLGLPADRELARSVEGVDVIVGGHSHSYLGPDSEEGPYPIVERSPEGHPVLVVTAKRAAQYLGELQVRFDANGIPTSWSGGPRELEPEDPVAPDIRALVQGYAKKLDSYRQTVVGSQNNVFPDGMDACRAGDCLGGMVTADAMLEFARPFGASVALCNGGGIRAALPVGTLTRGDVLTMHPFGNIMVVREYTGEQLWQALEHGVAAEKARGPRLLQPAGLRYTVDATRPTGSRVLAVETIDAAGKASPLRREARYGVMVSDYLSKGGDGYAMLKNGRVLPSPEPVDAEIVEAYLSRHSPLPMPKSGRIVRVR